MRYLPSLTLLAALAFLYGCAAAVIGGAAAGGYMLGEERRPTSVLADDQAIEFKIANQISEKFVGSHVNTTSYNRMVLLTGEVQSAEMKAAVEKIARGTENVRGVYNEVQIGPVTALSARSNDSYVTGKVKARFVDAGKFHPLHVKVVTEAGTVFLMGLVKRKEADDATEVARTTAGVQRVVRVFEIQE
jgi:osmotically-inducible protein OsmY